MKKIIFLAIITFFVSIHIYAQEECLTPNSPPPAWMFNPALRVAALDPANHCTPPFLLRIYVHIVRSSSGVTGIGTGVPDYILTKLNSDYSETQIQFKLKGFDYIDNNKYYDDLTESEANELFTVNNQSDAINIYVLGTSTTFLGAGMAAGIPATSYLVLGGYYDKSTLPHEMGHCLGLWHTHHGTVTEYDDPQQCKELVNGSNSLTCGDYIEDTPADPCMWSNNSCSYVGTAKDANNQQYQPDPSLFMSYSYKPCRIRFTPMQIASMHNFICNNVGLQNTLCASVGLMIRDDLQDDGTEPNPRAITWNSPDINLKGDDGTLITPCNISDYEAGTVWVRVWNKSDEPSPAGSKLHVYWANRIFLSRASDFSTGGVFTKGIFKGLLIGQEITPTGGRILNPIPGKSYVDIPVAFNIPNNSPYIERLANVLPHLKAPTISWRFALMAIIDEAGETPITSRLNIPSAALAKQYNNVAVDNGNVIFKSCFSRLITLDEFVATPFQFNVGQLLKNDKYLLRDFAELNIILSPDLMSKLIKDNQSADGFKIKDDYTLLITSPNATLRFNAIDNIDAELVAGAEVHFISDKMPELNDFDFDFTLAIDGKTPETMRFTAVRDENVYFKAQAEASKTKVVRAKEEVTLTSNVIYDDADYTWYNESGEKIGAGYQITILPDISQTYKIEILKKEDGYKSYDEVAVMVVDGMITSLSPNPAQSRVRVDYKLSDNATNASVQISDLQNLVSVSCPLSTNGNQQEISLSGFVPGTYLVKLIISGVAVDAQTLIIH